MRQGLGAPLGRAVTNTSVTTPTAPTRGRGPIGRPRRPAVARPVRPPARARPASPARRGRTRHRNQATGALGGHSHGRPHGRRDQHEGREHDARRGRHQAREAQGERALLRADRAVPTMSRGRRIDVVRRCATTNPNTPIRKAIKSAPFIGLPAPLLLDARRPPSRTAGARSRKEQRVAGEAPRLGPREGQHGRPRPASAGVVARMPATAVLMTRPPDRRRAPRPRPAGGRRPRGRVR